MLEKLIKAAKGEIKADIVLKGGTVVNVLSGTLVKGDVAIVGETIAGIGKYSGEVEYDCRGQFILPGLIDTHVHIESSMLSPREFVRHVLAQGTTSIVADPHEIANVCGMAGVEYIAREIAGTPINAMIMLPSCVPATPSESSGAVLDSKIISEHIAKYGGLGEFMNYVGVVGCDREVLAKIKAAKDAGKVIDGHCIGLTGNELNAYAVTGVRTNHENITPEAMAADIERGLYVQMRQGCFGDNVTGLVPGVTPRNLRRCTFCSDDKRIKQIRTYGHINHNIRLAVAAGMNPVDAVTVATLNAAECYGMKGRGAVAPSYIADILVVDNLRDFNAKWVFVGGETPRRDRGLGGNSAVAVTNTVHIKRVTAASFAKCRMDEAIDFRPKEVLTGYGKTPASCGGIPFTKGGIASLEGVNKIAVVERHKATGRVGVCLIRGFGLERGAIAQTIAHDSHNIIVVGANDDDMAVAVNHVAQIGGGIVVADGGRVVESLPLEIAGLMTDAGADVLEARLEKVMDAARGLGIALGRNPVMELSFLALPVIPAARITDRGLVRC